jgi:hypothetical protein
VSRAVTVSVILLLACGLQSCLHVADVEPSRPGSDPPLPEQAREHRRPTGSQIELDEFIRRLLDDCPQYRKPYPTPVSPQPPQVITDFPDELHLGYPKVTLAAWFRNARQLEAAIRLSPQQDCMAVRLSKMPHGIAATLVAPSIADASQRHLYRLEVEPVLLDYWQHAIVETWTVDRWVSSSERTVDCGDAPSILGVLTVVTADIAIFAGQPARFYAECTPYSYDCECRSVTIAAEPYFGGCTEQRSASGCEIPAEAKAVRQALTTKEPWLARPNEESPILYRSYEACLRARTSNRQF